jgi:hypothetical protein
MVFDESIFPFASLHENAGAHSEKKYLFFVKLFFLTIKGGIIDHFELTANDRDNPDDEVQEVTGDGQEATGGNSAQFYEEMELNGTQEILALQTNSSTSHGADLPTRSTSHSVEHSPAAPQAFGQHTPVSSPTLTHGASRQASSPAPAGPQPENDSPTADPGMVSPIGLSAHDISADNQDAHSPPAHVASPSPEQIQRQRPRTRAQSGIVKQKLFTDGTVRYGFSCETGEPRDVQEALGDKNWKRAMQEEHSALLRNNNWHLVPPIQDKNLIDCKWVYRIKRKQDGTIDRYKARLVAKGFK